MSSARKLLTAYMGEVNNLVEDLFKDIEEYALMNMVNNLGGQLEKRARERKMLVDNRALLIPGNAVYEYHAQFPLRASFLHLTWFELMCLYRKDIRFESFDKLFHIIQDVEDNNIFNEPMYDKFFDYVRDGIFDEGDSIMQDVIISLKDVLIENGCMVSEIDPNRHHFQISW